MRAFYLDLNELGPWGLAGREYLRLVRALGPYVVRNSKNEGVKPPDAATARALLAQADWVNPPTATFYHGWLADLARIEPVYTPPGGYSVAIVNWPDAELPDVSRLDAFSAIWVSMKHQHSRLRDAGLRAFYVPIPLDRNLDIARLPTSELRMVVAAGTWEGPDNLEEVTRGFLAAFQCGAGYGLHLVCPDRRALDEETLCELAGRPFEELPPVSVAPTSPRSSEEWLNLLACCDTYVSLRDDGAGDFFALLAAQAGCRVAGRDAVLLSLAETEQVGYMPDELEVAEALPWAVSELKPVDPGVLHSGDDPFAQAVRSTVDTAEACRPQLQLRLGVVVTHRDQGHELLAATLRCLCPQLLEDDLVVVVDQSSDRRAWTEGGKLAADKYGALTGSWMGPDAAPWSRAWSRNYGAKIAMEHGAEALLFVDCGLVLPQSAIWQLRYLLEGLGTPGRHYPFDCATVTVCPGAEFLDEAAVAEQLGGDWSTGRERTTDHPGNLLVRAELFRKLRGFDEEYAGQGYEAQDFKLRARASGARWVDEVGIVAYRQPGVPAGAYPDVSSKLAAEGRFKASQGGRKTEINPHGWGRL
jgi:hypothetical protein